MPYATLQDLIDRFGEEDLINITDRKGMGVIDQDAITRAQVDGDAEIDSYIQPLYQLPLATVPPNMVRIACDIYRYYLFGNLVPDYAQTRYDHALATLRQIQSGKIKLIADQDTQPAPEPQIHVKTDVNQAALERLGNF